MEIIYRPSDFMKIDSVSIEWKDGSPASKMLYTEDGWIARCQKPEGEHLYRFVLNGDISINDPDCNTYELSDGQVYSVLIVNSQGLREYDADQYNVHIEDYHISSDSSVSHGGQENHKSFDTAHDQQVCIKFLFTHVTGVHTTTLLWLNPNGSVFDTTEQTLVPDEANGGSIQVWFNLDLQNGQFTYQHGIWKAILLIDGEYVLEDSFSVVFRMVSPLFVHSV